MFVLRLVIREILHRRLNFALSLGAIVATVAVFVAYLTLSEGSRRETVRVTRDIGFNLRIIPRETDMEQFWSQGYSDRTMPETTLKKLASYQNVFFAYNHLVASLQGRLPVGGQEALLTGLAPAVTAPGQSKQPMGFAIAPGTTFLGFEIAQRLGKKKGDTLQLEGQAFKVEQCLSESGTDDDVRIYLALRDAQRLLKAEGLINEIKAIDCLCLTSDQDPLKILRAELEKALPEARVIQLRNIADARAKQRQMVEKYLNLLSPLLLAACMLWVCLMTVINVRERRVEIGILRALGYGSPTIALLFFSKALLQGALGAAIGYGVGSWLALRFGPEVFKVTAAALKGEPRLLWQALWLTPGLATLAALVPTTLAITQDPATTLSQE